MPNADQELEHKKTTDSEEQTEELAPAQEEEDSLQDVPEPVQAGSLSDADRTNLMEDPAGGDSPRRSVAELRQQLMSQANRPFERPQMPLPGQNVVAERRQQLMSQAKRPFERPQTPAPGRSKVAAQRQQLQAQTTGQPAQSTGQTEQTTGQPAQSTGQTEQTTGQPAQTTGQPAQSTGQPAQSTGQPAQTTSQPAQPTDQYALLKRDVSSLSDAEKQERPILLKKKYVDDWKQKKSKRMEELTEGLTDDEKSKEETRQSVNVPRQSRAGRFFEGVDNFMEIGDKVSDYAGMGISAITETADAVHSKHDIDDHGATDMASNITGIVTGGWGTLSGSYGLFRSAQQARQKRKKGDSRGAALSRFDAVSNLFGAASGATGMASGITGLTGSDASDWLGHASSVADMGGSLTNVLKGAYQKRSYGKLAKRKETGESKAKMANEYMRSNEKYKKMKEAYDKNEGGARSKENRMEMLKQRHAQNRSKDFIEAMESAQEHAKIRSKEGGWGIASGALSTASGGIGFAGSLAKQFGGVGGKIAGAVLGGISSLMKVGNKEVVERVAKSKGEAAKKKANDTSGKKYLDEKVASFLKKSDAQSDHVTEEEAKVIIAQRLGVDDPSKYAEIYKKLSERRADRILNKEEGYQEVLAAMGLTEDADKATILEALGVS